MGLAFSEPLEQLCLAILVVFAAAGGIARAAQKHFGPPRRPRRRAPAKPASTSKRRKHKPVPEAPRPEPVANSRVPQDSREENKQTSARQDSRTLVDGIDLADIVDIDLEPMPGPWREVEPRRRKRVDNAAA
mmetsp:Transcript_4651/g.13777  ORF Transcript_4651/g.13777 Transcript_4651/m.13777 type:complete len:132 (-) Transcript_4651:145-540(-)